MNLKKILAVVLSMTLLVSCLVSGMSLNTSATTPDPETDAKANLEAAWAALEYKPVVVHDGFWKKTTNDNGANWNWPGSAAASDSELELADGTKIPAYSVVALTDPASKDEAFIVSDKNSHNRPTSNVPVVEGTKLYFYVSGEAIDGISAFYCRANEDVSFYPTFTKEMITDNGGETWTKYGCTVESGASLVNQKLGRLQFSASTQIFGKKVSAVLIQDPITVPQEDSLLELVKKAENIDLNEIQDGEAKNNFVSALAAAVEVLYTTDANTISYLTYKWGRMSKNPEVVFENFVEKNPGWTDTTTNSTYNSNIGANVYSATAGKPLIVVTGVYDNPTKWANFKTYDEIYFYYSSPNGTAIFAPDICTEDSSYASYTSAGPSVTLTQTTDSDLVKFDLMTATKKASGYNPDNYYATGAEKRAMFRLNFGSVPTNFKISQVFGVKKTDVPNTTDKTLGEVIKLAEAVVLSDYQDNAAKAEFETALAKAKAAYLSNEANAIAHISNAWLKVKHNREVIFDTFTYKDASSEWQIINSNIDDDDDGTNDVTYKTAEVNGETVTLAEGVGNLSGSKPGFILVNKAYEAEKNQNDNVVAIDGPKNEAAMFDIYDYEEAYLYYSTNELISINLASTKLNTDFGGPETGGLYVSLNENSENGDYKKLDLFAKLNAIEGNTTHSSYGYTGTLDRNVNGEEESDTQYDSALCRAHIGGQYSQLNGISYLYGVKKVKFDEEFGDLFVAVAADGTTKGTLEYAKGLTYAVNSEKTSLADWMEAYNKYEQNLKDDYNQTEELFDAVQDVKAANPAVRMYGEGIYNSKNEESGQPASHVYTDPNDGQKYTSYRVIASYICPMKGNQPELKKIRVYGKDYDLVSRSISIWRQTDSGTPKTATKTGDDLNKCWDWTDNKDGTATVQYSIYIEKIPQNPAESNIHEVKAWLNYNSNGQDVQFTTDVKEAGTVLNAHIKLCDKYGYNPVETWFPSVDN